jgi:hypothetical protein
MAPDCPHACGPQRGRYQAPIGVHAVRDSERSGARLIGYTQQTKQTEISLTSFNRRASSASVCGGAYFAGTRRRTLVLAGRLASGSASTCDRDSCRLFVLCPEYASLRRTASLYKIRSVALAAQRFNASRTTALVLANADARASSTSVSTAGALPFPLLFPFRIGTAVGAAVGDAISTSCGLGRDIPLLTAAFGESRCTVAID